MQRGKCQDWTMVQSSDSKCCSHMGGNEEDSRGRARGKTGLPSLGQWAVSVA